MNLAALANIGGGIPQGFQNIQGLQQRAQQLHEAQMNLDTHKKALAAQAAIFTGDFGGAGMASGGGMSLPGGQSPPPPPQMSAQPMPPGQPSMPAQTQQGGPAMPGQPQGGMPAPQPQQAGPVAPQTPQQQGGGQQPVDPTDPRAAVMTVMQLAKEFKSRNPGIDPQTLFQAVSQTIDLSKGLAPALRAGAQVVVQQLRDRTSRANTGDRVGATERGQDMQQENVATRTGSQERIAAGHDATSIQRVQQQGSDAMARAQAMIQGANARASQGIISREKVTAYKERAGAAIAKLKASQARLSSLATAAVTDLNDPRVVAAQKAQTDAIKELDRVNSAAKMDGPSDAPAASGGADTPATGGARPTATSADGKTKLEWDGKAWVPAAAGK